MKIVIAEAGPAENIGSMALIENAIRIARDKFPKCEIVILTPTINSVINILKKENNFDNIKVINDLFTFPTGTKFNKIFWLISSVLWIILIRFLLLFKISPYILNINNRGIVLREVIECDYVFCIGAERINDIYFKTVFFSLEALNIYQKLGKKLIHFSLTIGPVFYRFSIQKAIRVLQNSHAIFVRDQKSFDLLNKWKIDKPYIYNSYDIALLQRPLISNELLVEFKITDPYVCVSVIEWNFRKATGSTRQQEYNLAFAEAIDCLIEKYQYQIVFTPTVINSEGYKVDDVEASNNVIAFVKNKNKHKIIIIDRLLTPSELSYVFFYCRYSIVTRMHAAILCSGAGGKPIIAVNYLYKLREYMKIIGFEEYSVDIDYLITKDIITFIDQMEKKYDYNIDTLSNNIEKLRLNLLGNLNSIFVKK